MSDKKTSGSRPAEDTLRQWIEEGKKLYAKKDFEAAEKKLLQVVNHSRAYADVFNMLGVIAHTKGLFTLAQQAFQEALAINPGYIEAAINMAVTLNDLGQYEDAKSVYTKALARTNRAEKVVDPHVRGKIANMHAEIGKVYTDLRLYDDAAREYRQALDLCPSFADIRTKLANVLRDRGDHDEALTEYRRALRENPGYTVARINMGITLYHLGKVNEAMKEWEAIIEKDPDNKLCKMYLNLVRQR